ncbi:MAG: phycobilisome rod-core linker polypeptide [Prochlorotrichaceae cyanobacterium]
MERHNCVTVSRQSSREERANALRQIYNQVLERQPYAFERLELKKAEDEFLRDKIGVRRFLKELGHSELYLNSFYYKSSNQKFLEVCLKHFLGRSIVNHQEMHHYMNILINEGVKHLITAILDSEEYRKYFGCFTVPYIREQQVYSSPKAYLETQILIHEMNGRRGYSLPTLYWHQLGMDCDTGVCRHPEVEEAVKPAMRAVQPQPQASKSVNEMSLDDLLSALDTDAEVPALTERQRLALQRLAMSR